MFKAQEGKNTNPGTRFEDDVAKENILERCTKAAYKRLFRSTKYVRDTFFFTLHEWSLQKL